MDYLPSRVLKIETKPKSTFACCSLNLVQLTDSAFCSISDGSRTGIGPDLASFVGRECRGLSRSGVGQIM